MRIQSITFLCLSFLVVVAGFANSDSGFEDRVSLAINGVNYNLEIAKTQQQRSRGLMFRTRLADREGMLFVFARSGEHRIWMKNTLIPLTVIWLDENESVITIKQLEPCKTDPCPSFGASRPSRYIIELNAGPHDIKPGDRLPGLKLLE
ncbi:MAG: DUF192 domain-containing protein [Gammaproteobacteria bacterium]